MFKYVFLLMRKCRSAFCHVRGYIQTLFAYGASFFNPLIQISRFCKIGRSVKIIATDGGVISIGQRTCLGDYVQIICQGGRITIEDDVFIGTGSIIVCKEEIFIGRDTLIAEYVVIRDQDHSVKTRPVRRSGFHTSPIRIGRDVWVGCKASLLRGALVGDHCVIGAHALVKSTIADDMMAVGVPARAIRRI